MKKYRFNSSLIEGAKFECNQANIKNEPMFFNSDFDFAYKNGGPITKAFLDAVVSTRTVWDEDSVFDSRVHMLMPGWYPCIPGWHHDDVPRSSLTGQPDYDNQPGRSYHIMALVNADVAPTKFAIGNPELNPVPEGKIVYKQWHDEIEILIDKNEMRVLECPDKQIILMDSHTFHTGQKAVKSGWRWFGRISKDTDRSKSTTNEIRKQVQVYLEFPTQGW